MKFKTVFVLAVITLLPGCSVFSGADDTGSAVEESNSTSGSAAPTFKAETVEPVRVPVIERTAHDPGLNTDVHFQGTSYGNNGGSIIYIAVTNRNDVALPSEALKQPTLTIKDNNGSTTKIDLLEGSDNLPLDKPLGVEATTNLHWAFDTSNNSLWNAEFQIGNVVFFGNLNN